MEGELAHTLQRSHACPVRVEPPDDFFCFVVPPEEEAEADCCGCCEVEEALLK